MTIQELHIKHKAIIDEWLSKKATLKVKENEKVAILEFATVMPDVNNKLKTARGCSDCMSNCARMILTNLSLLSTTTKEKDASDFVLLNKNVIFKINKVYKLDMLNIMLGKDLYTIVDKEGFKDFNDTTLDINSPDTIELLRYYLSVHPNMTRYFIISEKEEEKEAVNTETIDSKEVTADENIDDSVVNKATKTSKRKRNVKTI